MRNSCCSLVVACVVAVLALCPVAWGQDTFTGSRGFAPTFKTSDDTPAPTTDLSIQVPGNVELNGCLRFTQVAGDVCQCFDDSTSQLWLESDCDGIFEGSPEFFIGASSGGGITKTITDATDISSSFSVGNGTNGIRLYADSTSAYLECFLGGSPCPPKIVIPAGEALEFLDGTTVAFEIFPDAATPNLMYRFAPGYQLLGSAEWGAWNMFGDGTECDTDPTGTPPTQGIACPMTTAETDGTIEGTPITWQGDWDKTADVTFHIKAYLTTDLGAGTWHGQIAIDCVAPAETPGTYGTAVGLDLTPAVGDVVGNEIHDVAAAVVDTDTTGADCDPGDTLYWQFASCDTDATPSTGCTSSAGFENDMSIFSIRMEYKRNSLSE